MHRFLTCLFFFVGLLVGAVPAYGAETDPPNVEVRLWPNPNVARRGDIVRYDLTVTNEGDGKATRTRVTIPFPKSQLGLVKIDIGEKTTWVMEYTDEKLVIMYGTLRRGERRDTQIYLKVEEAAAPAIRIRATVRHDSENGSGLRSNETLLTIQGAEADVTPAASVEPGAGPVGTLLHFSVRNYFPEEKIFTWLNAPGGVIETKLSGQASEEGAAGLDFNTSRLAPGKYSMVLYGETSKTTLVVPFELTQ